MSFISQRTAQALVLLLASGLYFYHIEVRPALIKSRHQIYTFYVSTNQ